MSATIWHGRIINMDVPESEVPTRVAKQLKKLVIALALIRGHKVIEEEDMDSIRHVARDSAISKRQMLVERMMCVLNNSIEGVVSEEGKKPFTVYSLLKSSGIHHNSVRIEYD